MAKTPEDDLLVDPLALSRLGGTTRESAIKRLYGLKDGSDSISSVVGEKGYQNLLGQDPTKAMLKSSEAMLGEIKEQTRLLRDTAEMMRQSNQMSKDNAAALKEAVREAAREARASVTSSSPTPADRAQSGGVGPAHRAPDGVVDLDDIAKMQQEDSRVEPAHSPTERTAKERQEELRKANEARYHAARAQPVATIRKELFSNVAERISSRGGAVEERFNRSAAAAMESFLETGNADDFEAARMLQAAATRSAKVTQIGRNVAGNVAEKGVKGGIIQSVGQSGLARVAGTAALAYGAIDGGLSFAENQREKNRAYQAATGDSNFGGFAFRTRQNLFGLTQRGRMGNDNAQRLYGQLTMMNMDEQTRAEALDFASDAFMRLGMSVEQSVSLIGDAVDRGETNFQRLGEALESVTDAAARAGVNAEQARANFGRQLGTATQVVGSGDGAMLTAQVGANFQTSMGRQFADNQNFNPLLNPLNTNMYAAQTGQAYQQVISGVRSGHRDQILGLARQADATSAQAMNSAIPREAQQRMQREIERRAVERGFDSAADMQANSPTQFNNLLVDVFDNEVTTHGTQMDQRALYSIAKGLTGTDPSSPEEAIMATMGLMSGRGAQTQAQEAFAEEDERRSNLGLSEFEGSGMMELAVEQATGVKNDTDMWFTSQTSNEYRDDLIDVYTRRARLGARETGGEVQRSGVIENLISGTTADEKFVVEVNGERRVVSAEDAIRHFSDQLQAGSAEFFGGERSGLSVADALDFDIGDVGTSGFDGTEASSKNEDLAEIGEALEDARGSETTGSGGQRVEVVLGPGMVGPNGQPLLEFIHNLDRASAYQAGMPAPSGM